MMDTCSTHRKNALDINNLDYQNVHGLIKDLELQKEYILQDKYKINNKTIRKISYIADFSYISVKDNKLHVIDVKGFKTDVYKLKKKLFEYKYGIEIEEE